jgi:hypothetical protein
LASVDKLTVGDVDLTEYVHDIRLDISQAPGCPREWGGEICTVGMPNDTLVELSMLFQDHDDLQLRIEDRGGFYDGKITAQEVTEEPGTGPGAPRRVSVAFEGTGPLNRGEQSQKEDRTMVYEYVIVELPKEEGDLEKILVDGGKVTGHTVEQVRTEAILTNAVKLRRADTARIEVRVRPFRTS